MTLQQRLLWKNPSKVFGKRYEEYDCGVCFLKMEWRGLIAQDS